MNACKRYEGVPAEDEDSRRLFEDVDEYSSKAFEDTREGA